ncbi:LPAR6 protein, partial [Rostratula benghalensis]|nr:LPAR6 protein [Rostratula benghalensis]
TMAGIAEGVSNETVANSSSELSLEADFQYSLFTVIYSVVFVLGLVENVLVLYLLSRRGTHASHSYVYMMNLALVDTLFVCVLPFKIHYHLNRNNWVFGDMACRVTGTLYYINIYLSIAFFTCICVDRYMAVSHPFTYIQIKALHYVLVVVVLWVVALSVTVPLILGGPLHNGGKRNTTACFENFPTRSWTRRMAPYNILALVFGFVIPFSIILVSYPLIAKRISRIRHSIHKRKALTTISVILLICTLCFLPYHLTHLLYFLMRVEVIRGEAFACLIYKMRRVTLALVSINCCLNPLLYCFTSSSRRWRCTVRPRGRPTSVYTICDRQLRELSYLYKVHEGHRKESPGGGVN